MNTTLKILNKFTIFGELISLNDYTRLNRTICYSANDVKKSMQQLITLHIRKYKVKPVTEFPLIIKINWYEKDNRRDVDNIVFAKKFILDALVNEKIIKDDSRKYVKGFIENVYTDSLNPRIEVELCTEQTA